MATEPQQNAEPQQLKVGLWGTVPRRLLFLFKIIMCGGRAGRWMGLSLHTQTRPEGNLARFPTPSPPTR